MTALKAILASSLSRLMHYIQKRRARSEEDILCGLKRIDRQREQEFKCYAYEPKDDE